MSTFGLLFRKVRFSRSCDVTPNSLVKIVCKHQKSNIFWNSAFAGLNSFVAFAELQHIVSFQTQFSSNAGLCGTALAMSRAQEESGNRARSVPAQCGDASVPASLFTRLVHKYVWISTRKKRVFHCVIACGE